MNFTTTVAVQPFERAYSLSFVDFLCKMLPAFGIIDIEVMYGWAWGNEVFSWETRKIALDSLPTEIKHVESQGFGKIGDDDPIISISSHNLEITLCHETDLHIKFVVSTSLIEKVLEYVSSVFSTIAQEKQPFTSSVFFSDKPTFLASYDIIPSGSDPFTILLEQWSKTLKCSPKELLRITAYSSQAGLLKLDESNNVIRVEGWNSSNIRVHCDKQLLLDTKEVAKMV